MKTLKRVPLSKCCSYKVYCVPPSFGEPSIYVCEKCNTITETKHRSINTHNQISKGLYRPVDNSDIGY